MKKVRKALNGLTQEEFADKLGVHRSAVARWETDNLVPDRDSIKLLLKVAPQQLAAESPLNPTAGDPGQSQPASDPSGSVTPDDKSLLYLGAAIARRTAGLSLTPKDLGQIYAAAMRLRGKPISEADADITAAGLVAGFLAGKG